MIHKTRLPVDANPQFWAAKGRIPLWKIAIRLEVSETTLIRWLRSELKPLQKERILNAIELLKNDKGGT